MISSAEATTISEKAYLFHTSLRTRQVEQYKSQVRRELSIDALNHLLDNMPQQLRDVISWSENIVGEFSNAKDFKFPDMLVKELFVIVQTYTCSYTVDLLHAMCQNISINGVHLLFQYDIMGLLQKIMLCPEKILCRTEKERAHVDTSSMYLDLTRKCLQIVANLCRTSEKARNFIVAIHKTNTCLIKVYQQYGHQVRPHYLQALLSFTLSQTDSAPAYDEQFVRIIRHLIMALHEDLPPSQLVVVIEGLKNVLKWKQKWVMDILEDCTQFDLLERMRSLLSYCVTHWDPRGNQVVTLPSLAEKGRLCHNINMFLIYYIEVSTNQYFEWEAFFKQWFAILDKQEPQFFQSRRDVYFIINNEICEPGSPEPDSKLARGVILNSRCIRIFARALQAETNQGVFQELSICIRSLLRNRSIKFLARELFEQQIISRVLEAVVSSRFEVDELSRENLLTGLIQMLENTEDAILRGSMVSEILCFGDRLSEYCKQGDPCLLQRMEELFGLTLSISQARM